MAKTVNDVSPKQSLESELFQSSQKVLQDNQNILLAKTKTFNPSMYDKKLEKLQSYGSKYQKYGYNPNRDNEKFYDDITSNAEQWKRSATGAVKLATIGFNDSLLFGAFANGKSNANDFGKVADIYSTQRGGVTGFGQNLLLNSGYTVGIMADMVLEEAALAAVTALTGGLSSEVTLPAMFAKGAKGISQIAKAFDKMNDLKKAINAVDKAADISRAAKFGNKALNFINPLEHTTKYIKALKNVKSVKELSNIAKLGQAGGAVFRDIKAAQLVHSESKLESNMLEKDMMDAYIKENPYATKQELDAATQHINDAKNLTYMENMGAIFLTNKLVFNNMYKRFDNLKGIGSFLNTGNVGKLVGTGSGATVIRSGNIFQKGFYQGVKDSSKLIFEKGVLSGLKNIGKGAVGKLGTYGISNLGEGLQETIQETIQAKNKLKGNDTVGGYFDNLAKGLNEQKSVQGLETFLSGFLMGGLVHPITSTVVKPYEFFKNKDYKQFTNNAQFKTERERKLKQLEEDAALVNTAYQNVGDVYRSMGNNLAVQSRLEDEMIDAAANGDRKTFQDKKDESYRTHLDTMMKHGLMDDFISHVKGFKDMELDQAKAAFGITDNYSKEQLGTYIDEKVKQAEKFKIKYERFKADYASPVNISKLKTDDPLYMDKLTYHHMWNKAVDDMIFDTAEFEQNLDRKQQLLSKVKDDVEANGLPYHLYNVLTTDENIQNELSNLESELNSLNQYESITLEIKQEISQKTKRRDALIRYQESLGERKRVIEEIKNLNNKANLSESENKQLNKLYKHLDQAEFRMKNRHGEYMRSIHSQKSKGKLSYDHLNEKSFEALRDYYDLSDRNDEITQSIDLLANPSYFDEYVNAHTKFADAIIDNHKAFVKKSIAKFRDKADTDNAVKELLEMGVSFDLTELDDLLEKGIMPKRFYNLETEEELKKSDPLYRKAQDKLNALFDNLIEQPILEKDADVYSEMGRGYRVSPEEKRSYSDLAKQYGFDKSDVRPVKEILQVIIDSNEATKSEKELAKILIKLVADNSTISFVDNLSRPNVISEKGESLIDARYSSNNYTNSFFSIEESILKNELQRLTEDELKNDEKFASKIDALRNQVIDYLEEKSKTNEKLRTNYKGLKDNVEFIKEAFANESFQYLLTEIKTEQNKNTTWFKFIEAVTSIFRKTVDVVSNSVFNEVVATVQEKIKFENLSQPQPSTTQTQTEQETKTDEAVATDEVQDIPVTEPTEYFDPASDVKTYPTELLNQLIADYKKAVEIGDADGVGMDKLSVNTLTVSFINWVNDSAQDTVESFADKYNAAIDDEDVISQEEYNELLSLGYTEEDIELLSVPEVQNILENGIEKIETEQSDENKIIDELINENINTDDETTSEEEESSDEGGEGTSSTISTEETQTEEGTTEEETTDDVEVIDSSTLKTNSEKYDYLVNILSKPNGVVRGNLLQKEGAASVSAMVLGKMKITFYDHENAVTVNDKGIAIKLKLVPVLTLENGTELTNVIEVYSGDRLLGVVAKNNYTKGKQTITENTTDEELETLANKIVDENEKLFSDTQIKAELETLGFNPQDIKKLPKVERTRIVKEQITKENYVKEKKEKAEAKKNEKKIKLQEDISKFLENKFDNVQTETELTALFGEVVKQFKNYKSELPFIQKLFNDARIVLANQKDFAKLKIGDKLLLNDGRIVKVKNIAKNSIEVVDFNSIIENKTNIAKNNFDKTVNKVINDFNKSEEEIASSLDSKNLDELSTIMSKFTAQTLSINDAEVSDENMLEHFKNCK